MVIASVKGQSAMKQVLLKKIEILEKKVDSKADGAEMSKGFKQLIIRLNMQGNQLAELDNDAPTWEEFKKLEKRVAKLENNFAS